MKKIGIIGGLGPESTVDYYKGIIEGFKPTYEKTGYPEITIESCNIKELLSFSEQNRWDLITDLLAHKFELLQHSGCDFGLIASNTIHKVYEELNTRSSLPVLSIVEAVCDFASDKNFKKLLLLGTKFTMTADFYHKVFKKRQIELVVPEMKSIEFMHEKIFSEIEFGIINPDTKQRFITIANDEALKHNCDGAIMGCTELPLIIKENEISVSYLDSTSIHIQKIIEECRH